MPFEAAEPLTRGYFRTLLNAYTYYYGRYYIVKLLGRPLLLRR
jgi:hypothetical protein